MSKLDGVMKTAAKHAATRIKRFSQEDMSVESDHYRSTCNKSMDMDTAIEKRDLWRTNVIENRLTECNQSYYKYNISNYADFPDGPAARFTAERKLREKFYDMVSMEMVKLHTKDTNMDVAIDECAKYTANAMRMIYLQTNHKHYRNMKEWCDMERPTDNTEQWRLTVVNHMHGLINESKELYNIDTLLKQNLVSSDSFESRRNAVYELIEHRIAYYLNKDYLRCRAEKNVYDEEYIHLNQIASRAKRNNEAIVTATQSQTPEEILNEIRTLGEKSQAEHYDNVMKSMFSDKQ